MVVGLGWEPAPVLCTLMGFPAPHCSVAFAPPQCPSGTSFLCISLASLPDPQTRTHTHTHACTHKFSHTQEAGNITWEREMESVTRRGTPRRRSFRKLVILTYGRISYSRGLALVIYKAVVSMLSFPLALRGDGAWPPSLAAASCSCASRF